MTIGVRVAIGERPHRIRLQGPGGMTPDGDGGYVTTPADLQPPQVFARITPATAADLERNFAATVVATATHLVAMPFHAGVTTATQVLFEGRTFNVLGVKDPEERHVELLLVCAELRTEAPA